MKALIQRVTDASVTVDGEITGSIKNGLLVFLGIAKGDGDEEIKYIADKLMCLRIFSDADDKMNLSVNDIGGSLLIVSQFTLYGDCRKGRRPSFDSAMPPKEAEELYEKFVEYCRGTGINAQTGKFGADMKVSLLNDGPVTFIIESRQ